MNRDAIVKNAFVGFKYTLVAQIVVLLLSVAKSIILPKILSIPDYGYWQVYVLYSTYVGVFALGYNDGIYLKYGQYHYDELPKQRIKIANRFYVFMLSLFTILAIVLCLLISDVNRKFALISVSVDIILIGINGLLIYILQITNQMKAYSFYSVLDKVVLLVGVVIIALYPGRVFQHVIIADVFSKACVTISLLVRFKDMFFGGTSSSVEEGRSEFTNDIVVGIKLMIANLMGMFVTGIGRILVDLFGDIAEYACYSFGITITNLVLVFITAVSLVLYPTLKRLPENRYRDYFESLNFGVTAFNFIALFAYFPSVIIIKFFYAKYIGLIVYVHFLFGVIVLQAKMQLLNNTFYKVLREEKALLKANMSCVFIFLVLSSVSFYLTRNVASIAICTFVAMIYRCYASEVFLRKKMGLKVSKDILFEALFVISFVLCSEFLDLFPALIVYVLLFAIFIFYSRSKIREIILVLGRKTNEK